MFKLIFIYDLLYLIMLTETDTRQIICKLTSGFKNNSFTNYSKISKEIKTYNKRLANKSTYSDWCTKRKETLTTRNKKFIVKTTVFDDADGKPKFCNNKNTIISVGINVWNLLYLNLIWNINDSSILEVGTIYLMSVE